MQMYFRMLRSGELSGLFLRNTFSARDCSSGGYAAKLPEPTVLYEVAFCMVCSPLHSVSVVDPVIPSRASMTSRNMASFAKHSCSRLCSVDMAISTENKLYSRPQAVSQSGSTDHELPSSGSCGRSSSLRLSPSPTRLILPGMCQTSMIWWDRTPSRQRACVALRLSLSITSRNAWQSVSTLTRKPQIDRKSVV